MNRQQEFVLRTIEERGVRFVRLWFTDIVGKLKSVAIAPAELEEAFEEIFARFLQGDGTEFRVVHEQAHVAEQDG